jgi:hypothetical protein
MAGAGKKTFTAGEVLTASDTNTYLMEQTVMNFAGTASRASAIPTPSTGMTSYIGVTGTASIPQIEVYTGSAWQTPYGLTQLANISHSASTTLNVNNVFSSAYNAYRIIITRASSVSATDVNMQMRTGTTNTGTTIYSHSRIYGAFSGGSLTGAGTSGQTAWTTGCVTNNITFAHSVIDVFSPFQAAQTTFTSASVDTRTPADGSTGLGFVGGVIRDTVSYDGFSLGAGVNLTMDVRVYGFRNS